MGIPHKAFNCKLILFCVSMVLITFSFSHAALAQDSFFVVKDVKVDVTAENSVVAQDKAFDQAQLKAFRILSARMVSEADAKAVPTPDAITISTMVKDYEVTNEKISAVRYIGTYTFRFREQAVSRFFSVTGVSYTETASNPLLVLPVFQKDGNNTIWSEDNIWMSAWSRANLTNGLVPVSVPIGDLADIDDIDDSNALTYERVKLENMLGRYNASDAAIMIAVPDMTLADIRSPDAHAVGRMRVSIYRTDRSKAEHVKDIKLEADGQETISQLYDRAVVMGYSALQKDWKVKTLASASQDQKFYVRVGYKNARQWVQAQQSLRTLPGVSNMTVLSLKKVGAKISFVYRGDEQRLRETLGRQALELGEAIPYGSSGKYIYDLHFATAGSRSFYTAPASSDSAHGAGKHTF